MYAIMRRDATIHLYLCIGRGVQDSGLKVYFWQMPLQPRRVVMAEACSAPELRKKAPCEQFDMIFEHTVSTL